MNYEVLGLFLLGVLARVILPYLVEWVAEPQPFNWRYLVGQLLAAIGGLLVVLVDDNFLAGLAGASVVAVFSTGYVFADLGRKAQKVVERWPNE